MKILNKKPMILFILVLVVGCYDNTWSDGSDENIPITYSASGEITIRDGQGKSWDITHALNKYGMKPEFFNFGIGIGAIPSVDHPNIAAQGDLDFPSDYSSFTVFGFELNNQPRAYSIIELNRHEIFNDDLKIGSDPEVAVAY